MVQYEAAKLGDKLPINLFNIRYKIMSKRIWVRNITDRDSAAGYEDRYGYLQARAH
jgi:hypothetical protein